MTFTTAVKNEIIAANISSKCCNISLLSSLIRSAAIIEISNDIISLSIKTSNEKLVKLLQRLVDTIFSVSVSIQHTGNKQYEVWIYDCYDILINCGIIDAKPLNMVVGINSSIISKPCCLRNYIKGLFIDCGYISMPSANKDTYHLEFALTNEQVASDLVKLLQSVSISAKLSTRKDLTVVYIKNKETISDLLAYLGANKAVLQLQNVIINRTVRNIANRRANCDYANTDKTQSASSKQIEAIHKLKSTGEYNLMDEKLKEVAQARLSHPYDSLEELAVVLSNTVTKSGINHRLRKIVELANIDGGQL